MRGVPKYPRYVSSVVGAGLVSGGINELFGGNFADGFMIGAVGAVVSMTVHSAAQAMEGKEGQGAQSDKTQQKWAQRAQEALSTNANAPAYYEGYGWVGREMPDGMILLTADGVNEARIVPRGFWTGGGAGGTGMLIGKAVGATALGYVGQAIGANADCATGLLLGAPGGPPTQLVSCGILGTIGRLSFGGAFGFVGGQMGGWIGGLFDTPSAGKPR